MEGRKQKAERRRCPSAFCFLLSAFCLLLTVFSPALAQSPPPAAGVADPPDVVVVVIPRGGTRDPISIAYPGSVPNAEILQDFRMLAANLRTSSVSPKIERGAPCPGLPEAVSASAELPGLVN